MNQHFEPSLRADFYDPYFHQPLAFNNAFTELSALEGQVEHMRDHMEAVLEVIYGNRDLSKLYDHLEEVCGCLGIRMPEEEMKISKNNNS